MMTEKKVLSREKFNIIVTGCLEILKKNGFAVSPPSIMEVPIDFHTKKLFEKEFLGWYNYSHIQSPQTRTIDFPLKPQLLERMTLECALVFARQDVPEVHWNESLNGLRSLIIDILRIAAYKNIQTFCRDGKPNWHCYKLWEEVARNNGQNEEYVVDLRNECRKKHPKEYEAE